MNCRRNLAAHTSAALLLGLAFARPAVAQALPSAEAEALALKGQGRRYEAWRRFGSLLLDPGGDGPEAAARAEYYATVMMSIALSTGDTADADELLVRALESPLAGAHAPLRDVLLELRLDCAQQAGDVDRIATLSARLGMIDAWWVIGPFDNERGAGHRRELPPEQGFDPDGVYDGKKRAVRWRPPARQVPMAGHVDLAAMLRPNKQVLAYAATCIQSDAERDVLMLLGTGQSAKVWLNGVLVHDRDVRRSARRDADAVRLPLRAGANRLLVKVGNQTGSLGLVARLVGLDRSRLRGVRVDGTSEAMAEAWRRSARAADAVGGIDLGARTRFAKTAERGHAVDALRLAVLLIFREPDDPNERRSVALAEQAAKGMADNADVLLTLSRARRRNDRTAAERDDNGQRADLEAVLALDPKHVQALLDLARIELRGMAAPRRAEQAVRRALAANPDATEAHRLLGYVLSALDLDVLADAAFEAAAAPRPNGNSDVQALGSLGDNYGGTVPRSRRIAWWRELFRRSSTAAIGRQFARQLIESGDRDGGMRVLREVERRYPYDKNCRLSLASVHQAAGRFEDALAAIDRLLAVCPEDADALSRQVWLLGMLERKDQQLEVLRTLTEVHPNRERDVRYLAFLEADEAPFFGLYQLDTDEVLAADPGPPADAKAANDSVYRVLDQTVIHAYRNGTRSVYRHSIARVLNEEGAQRLRTHWASHYWGEQRARLLEARLLRADGTTVRPKLSGARVRFPPLTVGDTVVLRERVDDTRPTFFGDYFGLVHTFAPDDGSPCGRSELVLVLEPGRKYRVQASNGAPEPERSTTEGGLRVERFTLRNLARYKVEPGQPSALEHEPLVRVSTFEDWNAFSAWWWNLIRRQIEVTPAMRAKVQELCAGKATEMEKIRAIYDFVTTEIRYTAWEFGVHGYKPYNTSVIFERRHGDCKDKALLIGAMLGEVGIEAWPVLIRADDPRSADDLTVAAVEQFNHCISYVPATGDRPAIFLDGTATYHPADTLPTMDQGADVLVVRGSEGGEIRSIDWADADTNAIRREAELKLTRDGNAEVRLIESPTQNEAIGLRELLGNETGKVREYLERRFQRWFGKVELRDYEHSDVSDSSAPVRLEARLAAERFVESQGSALGMRAMLGRNSWLALAQAPTREFAILLGVPRSDRWTLRYTLPEGFAVAELPEPTVLESPFGSYRLAWRRVDASVVEVVRELRWTTPRIEPAEYPEFREFVQRMTQADQRVVFARPARDGAESAGPEKKDGGKR